jgi:thiamine pyrophosphokinase
MRGFIYSGGKICAQAITDSPKGNDIVVAADSGYENAKLLGVKPNFIVGDFDSYSKSKLPKDAELVEVPAKKDFSDTQLAVDVALSHGADEIVIIGGLGGRLDHTLSNLGILRKLSSLKIRAIACDGYNRIRHIKSTSELIIRSDYKYFSVIADDDKARGVSIEGAKYPLKNATLKRENQYAISNEIEKNCALVSVKRGGVFIVESKDAE